jgi:hypothetical protein
MPKVSLAFFTVGVVYVLIGMAGGIYMGASEDHSLSPVHAHLNLIGFVMMSVMGGFYTLTKDKVTPGKLAWANFWLLNLSLWLMIPSLAFVLKGNKAPMPLLMASEPLAMIAVLLFLASIVRVWRAKT